MGSQNQSATLPLSDTTVVELGNLIAIPYTGVVLGDLGAEVVKVERPGRGDLMRHSGDVGEAIFSTMNRNKRSVAIDLQTEAGQRAYRDLVAEADIVIENLRPGVVERLRVDYDSLSADRDDLIYLSVAGFLQGGPYVARPGMDVVGQAMSGLMRMTGSPGEKPKRAGASVVDIGTGLFGAIGVFLALWMREQTGEGQRIDAGLFESASHLMNYWTVFAQLYGNHPPLGSSHPAFGLYDVFETDSEEWIFVGVISERQWPAFCRAIDAPELAEDERFESNARRQENEETLYKLVQDRLRSRDRSVVLDALLDADVPVAPVNDPSDLVDDAHLDALGLLAETTVDDEKVQTLLTPLTGSDINVAQRHDAPVVGEDTRTVFEKFGLADQLSELDDGGAFGDALADE